MPVAAAGACTPFNKSNPQPAPISMGIGRIGDSDLIFLKKNRWTFQVERDPTGTSIGKSPIVSDFCKISARPNITIEDTELNFLNEKTWIPGKASWETITVTYIDVATGDTAPLYGWLASVYDFTNQCRKMGSKRSDYEATGILTLYDGCGSAIEQWKLGHMWPTTVNFGDLAMDSSETVDIELTLRYSDVLYTRYCPNVPFIGVCSPCS